MILNHISDTTSRFSIFLSFPCTATATASASPLIGDRDGCVDAAAETDIVERVDHLNTGGIIVVT